MVKTRPRIAPKIYEKKTRSKSTGNTDFEEESHKKDLPGTCSLLLREVIQTGDR